MFGPLLDALFPKRCAGCGSGPWPFCGRCRSALVPLRPPWCDRCGAPAREPVASCRHCPPLEIAGARSAFLFAGPARTAVHRLKFAGWRPVAEALGVAMAASWDREADVATWVPLSRRRRADRGFDQAHVLAKVVGRTLGLPVAPLLRRTADARGSQARRGGAERRAAMRGVFAVRGRPPASVLLVDDVLTTGATAAACAEALRNAGASAVFVLTAARAASGAVADLYSAADPRPGLWLPGDRIPGSRSQPRAKRPT